MRILGHGRGAEVESTKSIFRKGDVLYGKLRPYLNKVAQPDFDGICSTDFLVFRESEQLDLDYLAQYLNQAWIADAATQASRGVELPRINWEFLANLPVSFPPDKSEQRAVANHLRDIRSLQSATRQRLVAAKRAIDEFRRSILAVAFSGRLTAEWRLSHPGERSIQGIHMSKAESANKVRSEVIDPPEPDDSTPVSWVWVRFGSIVDEIRNGISAAPAVEPPGRSILRISAVRTGSVDGQNVRYLRQEVPEWRTYLLREGDLLFTRYNGSLDLLGVCGLVRGLGDRELLYPDKLVRIRLDPGSVVPEYAELFFASPGARRRLTAGSVSSAGQQGISGATLKAQAFALPPKEEQKEIVRRTTELLDVSDQLLSHIDSAARATQTCAQVALAKAFEGDA